MSPVRAAWERGAWRAAWLLAALLPLAVLAVFFLWPVAALVQRGLTTGGALDPAAAWEVLTRDRVWRVVYQTLTQALVATTVTILLAVPGAFVLYRLRFAGQALARGLLAVPFVLPSVVVGVAFRLLFNGPLAALELDGTFTAVVAAMVFFNYPLLVRTVGAAWAGLDPRPAQAAAALGASPARVFLTVTLPSLAPAIASGGAVVFLFCATAFGVVLILGGRGAGTLETEIFYQATQLFDLRAAAVLSLLQLVVVAAALWVSARARARRGGPAATRGLRRRPTRGDWPALTITALTLVALAAPLVQLVIRSCQRRGQWTWANYSELWNGKTGLRVTIGEAIGNSVRAAAVAAALALALGTLVALVLSRRPTRRVGRALLAGLDAAFMLPLGVSAVTVGFGFLLALNRPPFDLRSSQILVPLAQAIVAIPLVVRTLLPSLRAIPARRLQAAAALGAGPSRVLWTIEGPVLARALPLAAGFALAVSLGEFGATAFLARPDAPTLPVMIYRLLGKPTAASQGMVVAASVVLALVTAGLMLLAERARPRDAEEAW